MFTEVLADPTYGIRGTTSVLRTVPPDATVPLIALDDIGALAALSFAEPGRFLGRVLEGRCWHDTSLRPEPCDLRAGAERTREANMQVGAVFPQTEIGGDVGAGQRCGRPAGRVADQGPDRPALGEQAPGRRTALLPRPAGDQDRLVGHSYGPPQLCSAPAEHRSVTAIGALLRLHFQRTEQCSGCQRRREAA